MNGTPGDGEADRKRRLLASLILEKHRKNFPTLARKSYLNFGAQGILPSVALDAIQRFFLFQQTHGPYSVEAFSAVLNELRKTREAFAAELEVAPETICLTENTSMGCNHVLWGLDWEAGDRILLSDHEYPGVIASVEAVARRFSLQVDSWPIGGPRQTDPESLKAFLKPRTRLLVISHILWDRGDTLPLSAIVSLLREENRGRERILRVLVDGAQAFGQIPLSFRRDTPDYYAFPAHKWVCGPEGVGGLFIRPDAFSSIRPSFIGPRGLTYSDSEGFGGLHGDARRFETSSAATALCAGVRAALTLHRQFGDADRRIEETIALAERLWRGLADLEPLGLERLQEAPPDNGLVFFRCPNYPEVCRSLEMAGILVRTVPTTRSIRVSVGYLTLPREIDGLLAELEGCLKKSRKSSTTG